MGQARYAKGFDVALHPDIVELPLRWRKPKSIFVNSMSDLFHEKVPDSFIASIVETMRKAEWHRFQLLTKRASRLESIDRLLEWPSNTMLGVTVEHRDTHERLDALRSTKAPCKFVSFEPLIGPIGKVDLRGIDWVIVGGESGPGARPMEEAWVFEIRAQAQRLSIPFFFKQWGGVRKKKRGRMLEGRLWDEMPTAAN